MKREGEVENLSEWITTEEAAAILGVSQRWVRGLCKAGKLEAKKMGRDWLVRRASVYQYEPE